MVKPKASVDTRAAALADLMAGEQPAVVAYRYGLKPATVRTWKLRIPPEIMQRVSSSDETEGEALQPMKRQPIRHPMIEQQHITLNELVARNLRAKLEATERIAQHVQSETWLQAQTAADMAALFTAIDKSAVDILDRMAAAHPAAGIEPPSEED